MNKILTYTKQEKSDKSHLVKSKIAPHGHQEKLLEPWMGNHPAPLSAEKCVGRRCPGSPPLRAWTLPRVNPPSLQGTWTIPKEPSSPAPVIFGILWQVPQKHIEPSISSNLTQQINTRLVGEYHWFENQGGSKYVLQGSIWSKTQETGSTWSTHQTCSLFIPRISILLKTSSKPWYHRLLLMFQMETAAVWVWDSLTPKFPWVW